jgi:hypothetical protein
MTIKPDRRSTTQGRCRITNGAFRCTRCERMANQLRVYWPGDQLCNSCFYTAMRTRGICPNCGHDGVLPGRLTRTDARPVCLGCAGIPGNYQCRTCHTEGEMYRRGQCARCALRDDLTAMMVHGAADPSAMQTIVEILCSVDRPESILTWKRSAKVQNLLTGLACGAIPLSQEGLDAAGRGKHITHLRSLLEHHDLRSHRDEHLARFESWLAFKLENIANPAVRTPVEQFATWHHLRRLRRNSAPGQSSDGPKRSAKQEITETIKFLTWLDETHRRTAATCRQQHIDQWLATGPTTRHLIRTFVVWATKSKINAEVRIERRQAKTTRSLTQDQRLAWLKELLTGDAESLPYRVAGSLLLLYAQPLVRIAALKTTAIVLTPHEMRFPLGSNRSQCPTRSPVCSDITCTTGRIFAQPVAALGTPWLFPSSYPGKHLEAQYVMKRLRTLRINLLGARNTAIQNLVAEVPPPVVAELLGYGYQVAQRHAEVAAQPWSQYVT